MKIFVFNSVNSGGLVSQELLFGNIIILDKLKLLYD
jgi:hypothetical protein